jgi:hypothetical protein
MTLTECTLFSIYSCDMSLFFRMLLSIGTYANNLYLYIELLVVVTLDQSCLSVTCSLCIANKKVLIPYHST